MKIIIAFIAGVALGSCALTSSNTQPQNQSTVSAAVTDNEVSVYETCDEVAGAISDLQDAIAEFDYENWREVVPKVKEAADDLEAALDGCGCAPVNDEQDDEAPESPE